MLYHGSDIENLKLDRPTKVNPKNVYGNGFYTSDNPNDCTQHGKFIYEVHLPYLATCYPVWDEPLDNHYDCLNWLRSFHPEIADEIERENEMYDSVWTLKNWYEHLTYCEVFSIDEIGEFFQQCNILGSQFTSGYYSGTCYCTFLPENVKIRGIADLETVLGYLE